MSKNSARVAGRHFLQIPGPTPVPDRILRAMDMPVLDHRGPEFQKLGRRVLDGMKRIFKTRRARLHLSGLRHRRLGSRSGQHAVAGRPRADVRDRPFRHAVEEHGAEARPAAGVHRVGLARRRRCGSRRGAAARRPRACHQGRVHRPQRDLDGMRLRYRRGAQGDRRGAAPGAPPRRHHLVARLDRLPPRRMGRRRHRRRLAEGAHAAARPLLQCGEREGARRRQNPRRCQSSSGRGRR